MQIIRSWMLGDAGVCLLLLFPAYLSCHQAKSRYQEKQMTGILKSKMTCNLSCYLVLMIPCIVMLVMQELDTEQFPVIYKIYGNAEVKQLLCIKFFPSHHDFLKNPFFTTVSTKTNN